jgi:pyruvate formate lyase activating enzyme
MVFFDESGGGVTFSGGEPLAQPEFLARCLELSRKMGLSTVVDTSGYAPWPVLEGVVSLTDLFLYDLKCCTEALHVSNTGVSNALILANLKELSRCHKSIWLRIPVIPGFNTQPGEMESLAELAAGTPGVKQVNLLPYHRIGAMKFPRVGCEYGLADVPTPSQVEMERIKKIFDDAGLLSKING